MALGAIASTGIGAAQELGFDPIKFLGGKEAGYGTTKPGTLAWYIDKLKGVNDLEAVNLAEQLISMRLSGADDETVKSFLKSNSNEKVLGPEEYGPVINQLNQDVAKVESQRKSTGQQGAGFFSGMTAGANGSPSASAGAGGIAGFSWLQLAFFGAVGYVLIKVANQ